MSEVAMGPMFIRYNLLEKTGDEVMFHKHNFAHVSQIRRGSAHVVKLAEVAGQTNLDGTPMLIKIAERDFASVSEFLVEANEWHEITALEDNTEIACMFTHRNPNGDVVQVYNGWNAANH